MELGSDVRPPGCAAANPLASPLRWDSESSTSRQSNARAAFPASSPAPPDRRLQESSAEPEFAHQLGGTATARRDKQDSLWPRLAPVARKPWRAGRDSAGIRW